MKTRGDTSDLGQVLGPSSISQKSSKVTVGTSRPSWRADMCAAPVRPACTSSPRPRGRRLASIHSFYEGIARPKPQILSNCDHIDISSVIAWPYWRHPPRRPRHQRRAPLEQDEEEFSSALVAWPCHASDEGPS